MAEDSAKLESISRHHGVLEQTVSRVPHKVPFSRREKNASDLSDPVESRGHDAGRR